MREPYIDHLCLVTVPEKYLMSKDRRTIDSRYREDVLRHAQFQAEATISTDATKWDRYPFLWQRNRLLVKIGCHE
jgi:hypothetical protein